MYNRHLNFLFPKVIFWKNMISLRRLHSTLNVTTLQVDHNHDKVLKEENKYIKEKDVPLTFHCS